MITSTIASELIQYGNYECYIKFNKDGGLYWVQKSIPEQDATEENISSLVQSAQIEAEDYFNTPHQVQPEVETE